MNLEGSQLQKGWGNIPVRINLWEDLRDPILFSYPSCRELVWPKMRPHAPSTTQLCYWDGGAAGFLFLLVSVTQKNWGSEELLSYLSFIIWTEQSPQNNLWSLCHSSSKFCQAFYRKKNNQVETSKPFLSTYSRNLFIAVLTVITRNIFQ